MLQPVTPAWVLLFLLIMTAAEAQLQVARGRRVTVSARPGEPLPEVWVAAGVKTSIVLDAKVDKDSVQLDATRFRLVDAGERSLIIETLVTPGEKERWVLRVRYVDGAQPEWAVFALVAHPTEVDLQVDAVRQKQTLAACQEQLAVAQARCGGTRAEVWVLADRLGGNAVQAKPLESNKAKGWAYRLGDGVLLVVEPNEKAGQPWTPTAATLRSLTAPDEEVKVRAVHVREGPLAPGEWSTIALEADLPSPAAGIRFDLALQHESGRSLTIEVQIPKAQGKESAGR